jgi:altronate dehydratase
VWVLDQSSQLIFRLLRQNRDNTQTVTEEELRSVVADATSAGVIEAEESQMIAGIMRLADRRVRGVMTPRGEIDWIDADADEAAVRAQLAATPHSRLLVAHGGTAILSETPEIYGAEHLLTRRAVSPEVAHKLIERIKWWENYTAINNGELNNNPSPGNKAGGLTTILEKSLGAVAKGGTSNLQAVYEYAETVLAKGFVYMDTPGYDPVSATGQVAGGANLICFTTGRGSAYGCAPVPSMKLATNSLLWQRQEADIDINCGGIVDGETTVDQMGEEIFQALLRMASGERSKSEIHGYGQNEFVPWQLGAVT